MNNILDKISKISIYLLVFLLPVFFLPWTVNVLDFNKQALLIFLAFISLFSWFLKSLKEGKINLNWSRFNLPVVIFLVILAAATLFSSWQYGSFWGWPLNIASGFLTILGFALLYFLIVNIFQKTEIIGLLFTLAFSSFLAVLFGAFQLFGKFFLPFDFAKTSSFNTIGTVNNLGVFAALLLPLIISLIFISKRFIKFLLAIFGLAMLGLIFLVNSWVAWIVLLIGMAVILIFGISRREIFQTSWLTLPMVLLVIALFFGIFRVSLPALPATPLEVSLSQRTTFEITSQTLQESLPTLFLGSGPSTFVYDYSKFKPETINQTAFWGVRFSSGASEILDKLATTGILGLISFFGILAVFLWLGLKTLIFKKSSEVKPRQSRQEPFWVLSLGIFASWLATTAAFFFYSANLSLEFLFWIFTASFIVLGKYQIKSWELKASSLANIGVSFIFIFILILGIGIFFLGGQRYIAEVRYAQGIECLRAGDNQASINYLLSAISHTGGSQDNYWRDLSQVYLFRIREELQKEDVAPEELSQAVTPLISNAVNSAKQTTDIAPENVANWAVRGFVYRQMINLIEKAEEWAINSYQKAAELEPTNPYIYTELGQVYLATEKIEQAKSQFQKALDLKPDYAPAHFQVAMVYVREDKMNEAIEKLEETRQVAPQDVGLAFQLGVLYYNDQQLEKAKAEFERAIGLNENYSNARYFLGIIYDKEGQKDLAIEQFKKIAELNPGNEEVKKILTNLETGKAALEGIGAATPIEEKPPERLEE